MNRPPPTNAFTLIEVTLALGIVAFGILAVFALLLSGMKVSRESTNENMAVNILSGFAADIGNFSGCTTVSDLYKIPLTTINEGSSYFDESGRQVTNTNTAIYEAVWKVHARDTTHGLPPRVYLRVNWPAAKTVTSGWVEGIVPLKQNVSTN